MGVVGRSDKQSLSDDDINDQKTNISHHHCEKPSGWKAKYPLHGYNSMLSSWGENFNLCSLYIFNICDWAIDINYSVFNVLKSEIVHCAGLMLGLRGSESASTDSATC